MRFRSTQPRRLGTTRLWTTLSLLRVLGVALVWSALFALAPKCALAHQTADSRLEVVVREADNEVDLLALLPNADVPDALKLETGGDGVLDPEDLAANTPTLRNYLGSHIGATRGGKACLPTAPALLRLSETFSHLMYIVTLRCPSRIGPLLLHDAALFERSRYRHLARIQVGDKISTTVFSPGMDRVSVALGKAHKDAPALLPTLGRFLWMGIVHIFGGMDHILFVLCLLILAGSLRRLFGVITAFTVAHTLTLLLSALDVFSLPPQVVEPAIAASILWMAGENAWVTYRGREKLVGGWRRILLTFSFGLVHGFGFSYVLRDQVQLPTSALLPALFSFNVGVELGQVAVVALLWPPLRGLSRTRFWRPFFYTATTVIGLVAAYWLVTRLMGV